MADTAHWEATDSRGARDTIVSFYDREVEIPVKTKELGRPFYEKQTYILKITPGDSLIRIDRQLRKEDPDQFPGQWEAYQKKTSYIADGTPLESWPQITRGQVFEFKSLNLFTVEHIANAPENLASKIIGFFDIQRNARNFLELAKDTVLLTKMQDLMKEKDEKLDTLQSQMSELMARLDKPKKSKKKSKEQALPEKEIVENDIT